MDLAKKLDGKIDFNLLKELSSFFGALVVVRKFEKYYGKTPIEQNFYEVYLKYSECQKIYGRVFNPCGTIKKQRILDLNSPKFILKQFQVIEEYLFQKKIINEKIFETDK